MAKRRKHSKKRTRRNPKLSVCQKLKRAYRKSAKKSGCRKKRTGGKWIQHSKSMWRKNRARFLKLLGKTKASRKSGFKKIAKIIKSAYKR
jgi:hypothetical protein